MILILCIPSNSNKKNEFTLHVKDDTNLTIYLMNTEVPDLNLNIIYSIFMCIIFLKIQFEQY